jgi:hypothetical protein
MGGTAKFNFPIINPQIGGLIRPALDSPSYPAKRRFGPKKPPAKLIRMVSDNGDFVTTVYLTHQGAPVPSNGPVKNSNLFSALSASTCGASSSNKKKGGFALPVLFSVTDLF